MKEYTEFYEDIKKAIGLCQNCRTKTTNIKMAKHLLTQLTAKSRASRQVSYKKSDQE